MRGSPKDEADPIVDDHRCCKNSLSVLCSITGKRTKESCDCGSKNVTSQSRRDSSYVETEET